MTQESPRDPAGSQPEALASLEAASRAGSRKPNDQGMTARPDTAPKPGSLEREEADAAAILKRNAGRDAGSR